MINLIALVLVIIATFLGGIGALLLKQVSRHFGFNLDFFRKYKFYLAVFIYIISVILFVYGLKLAEVSVLYPLTSLSYIWVIIFSVLILKEKMNLNKWLGVIFIITGVIIMTI